MPSSSNVILQRVDGEEIRQSTWKVLGAIVLALLGAGVCAVIAYQKWLAGVLLVKLICIGAFCLLVIPLLVLFLLLSPRVLISSDCVQLLNGSSKVVAELPFRNIARVWIAQDGHKGKSVAFLLLDPADESTYCPGGKEELEKTYQKHKYHYAINGLFQKPREHICQKILAGLETQRERGADSYP